MAQAQRKTTTKVAPVVRGASNLFSPALLSRARTALLTVRRLKSLTETLDQDKQFFRDVADGETLKIPVVGVGEVTIKAASQSSTKDVTVFDEEKFKTLPAGTQELLRSLGVVSTKQVTTGGAAASVVFTLNK